MSNIRRVRRNPISESNNPVPEINAPVYVRRVPPRNNNAVNRPLTLAQRVTNIEQELPDINEAISEYIPFKNNVEQRLADLENYITLLTRPPNNGPIDNGPFPDGPFPNGPIPGVDPLYPPGPLGSHYPYGNPTGPYNWPLIPVCQSSPGCDPRYPCDPCRRLLPPCPLRIPCDPRNPCNQCCNILPPPCPLDNPCNFQHPCNTCGPILNPFFGIPPCPNRPSCDLRRPCRSCIPHLRPTHPPAEHVQHICLDTSSECSNCDKTSECNDHCGHHNCDTSSEKCNKKYRCRPSKHQEYIETDDTSCYDESDEEYLESYGTTSDYPPPIRYIASECCQPKKISVDIKSDKYTVKFPVKKKSNVIPYTDHCESSSSDEDYCRSL